MDASTLHVLLVSILRFTPNHTPLKYRCPLDHKPHKVTSTLPYLGHVHMGFQVPSPTHVNKSQDGDTIPTFEPPKTVRKWLYPLKSYLDYFIQNISGLVLRVGPNFCSTQIPMKVSCLTFQTRCHVGVLVILGT